VTLIGLGLGAGLAAATVSYQQLRATCDARAVDGSADILTPELFRQARQALAGGALLLVAGGGGLACLSRRLAPLVQAGRRRLMDDGYAWGRSWSRLYVRSRLLLWLAALLALAAACRLPGLLLTPARGDESFTLLHYASQPLFILLSLYDQPNNHVLHSLLVHVSTLAFGDHLWGIRLPAFMAGLLLVPVTFAWARRCAGTQTGLLASALVAVSTPVVEYSTNARGYTLVSLFTLLLFLAARPAIVRRDAFAAFVFVSCGGLGCYTIPTMVFPLAGCLLWLLMNHRRAWCRIGGLALLAVALAAFCYTPVLATLGLRALVGKEYAAPLAFPDWLAALASLGHEILDFWFGGRPLTLLAASCLALIGAWRLGLSRPLARMPVIALLLGLVVLSAAMRRWPPARACLYLVPFLAVWVAASLSVLPRGLPRVVASLALLMTQIVLLGSGDLVEAARETGVLPEAAQVCRLLEPCLRPTDRVVLQGPSDGPMLYHLHLRGLPNALLTRPLGQADRVWFLVNQHHGQTLDTVLAVNNLALRAGAAPPTPVATLGRVAVLQAGADQLVVLTAGPTPARRGS
jgi:hypothetical protein